MSQVQQHHRLKTCNLCGSDTCLPLAKNAIGSVIQEYDDVDGWKDVGRVFERRCEAKTAMGTIPADGIYRRVYTALAPREHA